MSGNSSLDPEAVAVKGIEFRAGTLILMQCFILPGNLAILFAIRTFNKRTVSDMLIGCLALVDLLNGLGPVNISIVMYFAGPVGFKGLPHLKWLCFLYAWMSCVLRLLACFIATLMSLDRFVAIVTPFRYRTKVTIRATYITVLSLFVFSVLMGLLPVSGIVDLHMSGPICSFAFTSVFAAVIVTLGYLQLIIVIICYVSVIFGIKAFLSRQTLLKVSQLRASFNAPRSRLSSKKDTTAITETPLTTRFQKLSPQATRSTNCQRLLVLNRDVALTRNSVTTPPSVTLAKQDLYRAGNRSASLTPLGETRSSLARIVMSTTVKRSQSLTPNPIIKLNTDICYVYSETALNDTDNSENTLNEISDELKKIEEENEAKIQSSLREFKKNHTTWRQSRKVAVVMGIVVLLFYISWMPIVMIITMSLASQSTSLTWHFAAARMSLISSMLNFVVYGAMLKQYRQAYKGIFKRMCGCGAEPTVKVQPNDGNNDRRTPRNKWFTSSADKKINKPGKRVRFKRTINNAVSPVVNGNDSKPSS